MNEEIFEDREDEILTEDLFEVEDDEFWWTTQDEDEEFVRNWEIAHPDLQEWDY